jgi:hypothetical protein
MEPRQRDRAPQLPVDSADWVRSLMLDRDSLLDQLLRDERKTGDVVAILSARPDEASRHLARHIDVRANKAFTSPHSFARYWNQVEQKLRA